MTSHPENPRILALFDVDGTLTDPREAASENVLNAINELKKKITIGVVGGSDLIKQQEQLGEDVINRFHYSFSENGLVAFKNGEKLGSMTIVDYLGESKLKRLINFILTYIADLDIPIKRGTFIEFRTGMLNISPIGRNCSRQERSEFEEYDKIHRIREKMVFVLNEEFCDYKLQFSIGGQISFDLFPQGWDKTYCLKFLDEKEYDEIHFFGDKTNPGGNDYEIFHHPRTIGHSVTSPIHTLSLLQELFGISNGKVC